MKLRKFGFLILSFSIFGLFIGSCNHFNAPTAVWNPNQQYRAGAVISAVLPSNTAIAGVKEITIIGRNFSADIDSDWVWYDVDSAKVKSVSLGNGTDTLVVYRPANFGSNLYFKIAVPAADSVGTFIYNMEQPVSKVDLSGINAISTSVPVLEVGKGDTLYVATTGYVSKLSPSGGTPINFLDTAYLKPKMVVNGKSSPTDFAKNFFDMKFGPNGVLFATFNNASTANVIYRLDPDSSSPVVYATTTGTKSAGFLDFDDNGNLYTGNTKGLFLITPNGTSTSVGDYSSFTFVGLRVIKDAGGNKFIYAANSGGLYRSPINSDGTVGSQQQIYSIASDMSKNLAGTSMTSFTIGADGAILISVGGNPNYSLFVVENGSATPYYDNQNILPLGIQQLTWGNDRWLYLNLGSTSSYKMGIAKQDGTPLQGAPYIGRGL